MCEGLGDVARSPIRSAKGPKGMPKMSSSPKIGVFVSTSVSPGDGKDSGEDYGSEGRR